jgi:hypothetical protein
MESICRFGSCHLSQSIFVGRSLCDSNNITSLGAAVAAIAAVVVVVAAAYYSSIQDSHVVHSCLGLMVSFCLFSG